MVIKSKNEKAQCTKVTLIKYYCPNIEIHGLRRGGGLLLPKYCMDVAAGPQKPVLYQFFA